jgi:hypothetical protein
MADLTTIFVAGIGALTTLANGVGGFFLAGRNDEARDIRAAERDEASRTAALAQHVRERRHEWQREVLLELQDELQKLARATGRILIQDLKTVREHGGVFLLPEGLGGDESLAATVAVQRLRSRILADDLRALVGDFVTFCGFATTGATIAHKDDPPEQLAALIEGLQAELGTRYDHLVERLGEHIRRNEELG